ncbi:MAG: DUF3090 family protein [Acidimicrobiia bacterium]|nr:DUF3090 family protein [Acidimicrobiia bacterium]
MEYSGVSGFVADAIGQPGDRTFLLQFFGDWGRNTYLLEKGQVAALAAGVQQLMKEIDYRVEDVPPAPTLIDEVPHFRIGQLALGWDEDAEQALLTLDSVSEGDEQVVYRVSMEILAAAARQGEASVTSGRPNCERCGLAIDPEGHACPATNGDLRNHRP